MARYQWQQRFKETLNKAKLHFDSPQNNRQPLLRLRGFKPHNLGEEVKNSRSTQDCSVFRISWVQLSYNRS